jgi:hypothetical protein
MNQSRYFVFEEVGNQQESHHQVLLHGTTCPNPPDTPSARFTAIPSAARKIASFCRHRPRRAILGPFNSEHFCDVGWICATSNKNCLSTSLVLDTGTAPGAGSGRLSNALLATKLHQLHLNLCAGTERVSKKRDKP